MNSNRKDSCTDICKGRSLRSLPPVYAPSLVISHGTKFQHQMFCIPSDKSHYGKSVPEMRGTSCEACSYGWLLLRSYFSRECYLFNPVTLNKIDLPLWGNDSYNISVITSSPTDQDCLIMLFSEEENSCIFCRIGDPTWTEQELERRKKNDVIDSKGYISAVSCNRKIYLFHSTGIDVVDTKDSIAIIGTYVIEQPFPSLTEFTRVERYYLESCGEIFQVCGWCWIMSNTVLKCDVFKLDLSTMNWLQVDSIGDMIFLLDETYSVSVPASQFGAKGNCMYYLAERRIILYCYDMDDNSIRITQPTSVKFSNWQAPFWVVPDYKSQVKKETAVVRITGDEIYQEKWENWKHFLHVDLLQLIFQSLHLGDCIRFRLVSKALMALTPSTRPFQSLNQSEPQHLPWLISLTNNKNDVCHFYHPIYTDSYVMNIPQLEGAAVHHAKFGWLLVTVDSSIFFFNPSTMETIALPKIEPASIYFVGISFSSPPTSSDCVVFGHLLAPHHQVHMLAYHKEEDKWTPYPLQVSYTYVPSRCNPVFHDGLFYCLSKDGKVGVFDPKVTNSEESSWKVYLDASVPDVRSSLPLLEIHRDNTRSFIAESDGDIFCVFINGFVGKPVNVYKLDQSKKNNMKWIKVKSLGNRIMFLGHKTSLLIPAELKGTEDRIYLPRFKGNSSVFYSLKSGNYHSFGEQDSRADWIDTCEHWNCTWFLPASM